MFFVYLAVFILGVGAAGTAAMFFVRRRHVFRIDTLGDDGESHGTLRGAQALSSPVAEAQRGRESESLERSRLVLHGLLLGISESMDHILGSADEYRNALDGHRLAIKRAMTQAAIKEVERLMLLEVESMIRANQKYREKLEQANTIIAAQRVELERLQADAAIDFVTHIPNRRMLDKRLKEECARFARHGHIFSVIMLDIDHFKHINDQYGHVAGDRILRATAALIHEQKRESDYLARYGGEEFVVILPGADVIQATLAAEKIRKRLAGTHMNYEGQAIVVTVSGGIAVIKAGDSPETIIARADAALYRAKENGRNRIETTPLSAQNYEPVAL